MVETRTLDLVIAQHDFFADCPPEHLRVIAGCARNVRFKAGEFLFREGDAAEHFYIVRHGHIAIETHAPGRDLVIHSSGPGEVVGFSWLIPPYRLQFDGRATEDVRAISFDGTCLRGKCEADPVLGFDLLRRVSTILVGRMNEARAQAMDLFRAPESGTTTRLIARGEPGA